MDQESSSYAELGVPLVPTNSPAVHAATMRIPAFSRGESSVKQPNPQQQILRSSSDEQQFNANELVALLDRYISEIGPSSGGVGVAGAESGSDVEIEPFHRIAKEEFSSPDTDKDSNDYSDSECSDSESRRRRQRRRHRRQKHSAHRKQQKQVEEFIILLAISLQEYGCPTAALEKHMNNVAAGLGRPALFSFFNGYAFASWNDSTKTQMFGDWAGLDMYRLQLCDELARHVASYSQSNAVVKSSPDPLENINGAQKQRIWLTFLKYLEGSLYGVNLGVFSIDSDGQDGGEDGISRLEQLKQRILHLASVGPNVFKQFKNSRVSKPVDIIVDSDQTSSRIVEGLFAKEDSEQIVTQPAIDNPSSPPIPLDTSPTYTSKSSFRFRNTKAPNSPAFTKSSNKKKKSTKKSKHIKVFMSIAVSDALARIKMIRNAPSPYPSWLSVVIFALSSGGCCAIFFGGGWNDIAASTVMGIIVGLIAKLGSINESLARISEFLSSLIVGFCCRLMVVWNFPICAGATTISSIIQIVQGTNITLSVLELASRHPGAGVSRLGYSLTVTALIGIGLEFGDALALWITQSQSTISLTTLTTCSGALPQNIQWLVYIPTIIVFHIDLNAHPRQFFFMTVIATIAQAIWIYAYPVLSDPLSSFIASITMGAMSNIYSHFTLSNPIVGILSGLQILVPGTLAVRAFESSDVTSGIALAGSVMLIALSLGLGLFLGTVIGDALILPFKKIGPMKSRIQSSLSFTTLHIRQRTPTINTSGSQNATTGLQAVPQSQSITPSSIRFKTHLRNTILDVCRDRGWKETDSDTEWDFNWADVHWVHEMFDHMYLSEGQRINHFRNHYELTRKDLLVKNMKRMIKTMEKEYGKVEGAKFDFICTSYVLPQEHALFQEEFKRNPGSVWIMKPVGKAQGKGIFLINKLSQITQWRMNINKDGKTSDKDGNNLRSNAVSLTSTTGNSNFSGSTSSGAIGESDGPEAYIVQRYIESPYLIGGKKFDLRIYVMVTSYSPLVVYIHRNGFCRFSSHQFTMNVKDISNLYIHATNVAIQKHSPNYDSDKGCKWLLRNLKTFLLSKHGPQAVNTLFTDMEALVVRSLLSVQKVMIHDKHCFEIYGYDILIDSDLKPWLLEVNASPSLTAETQFDYDLKHQMLMDAFDVLDLEKRFVGPNGERRIRNKVGGFDLVYNDGPVKQERTIHYNSYLGCYHPIVRAPKIKKKLGGKTAAVTTRVPAPSDEE